MVWQGGCAGEGCTAAAFQCHMRVLGERNIFRTEEEVNNTLQRAELKSLMYKRMSRNLYSMNSLRSRNPNEMFEQVMRDRCVRLLEVSVLFFDSRKF